VGVLPFHRVADVPRDQWDSKRVRECMLPPGVVPNLTEDERAVDALEELAGTELERALVIDDGRLAGVLSIRELAQALQPRPRRRER
jgi:CBS domain-containing protein